MIIDDEPIAHRIIQEYCNVLPHLKLVNQSYNAFEAMQFLASNSVDLMFLDINMPKLTGFDFLKTLVIKPQVIVTTAYQEYALEGFELNVCDYLLKPYSLERFLKAVNQATLQLSLSQPKDLTPLVSNEPLESVNQTIFIKSEKMHHQLALVDIIYIEACGNYCFVFHQQGKIITLSKISQFEKDLPQHLFLRVHKSFIIAKKKISSISSSQLNIGETTIPIGLTYKSKVDALIK